jgi:hypothetical protein
MESEIIAPRNNMCLVFDYAGETKAIGQLVFNLRQKERAADIFVSPCRHFALPKSAIRYVLLSICDRAPFVLVFPKLLLLNQMQLI